MKCAKCSAVMPFNAATPHVFDCLFCDGKQYPDPVDLLSEPTLEFVHETRDGQIEMCAQIDEAIREESACIYEAGTGVGKSFAYLLPAILSGKRVVISTAKKTLQAQLLEKDLPRIRQYLAKISHPRQWFTFAGAYGRSNFACYLECNKAHGTTKKWPQYEEFFKKSTYGHWDDLQKLHLRQLDTSLNADGCIQLECTHYKTCGFIAARKEMLNAQVVVTNNWILGYHYMIQREDPNRHLLGEFQYLIVDEAHKIEDGIRSAFTNETALKHIDAIHAKLDALNQVSNHVIPTDPVNELAVSMQDAFKDLLNSPNKGGALAQNCPEYTSVTQVVSKLLHLSNAVSGPDILPKLFKNVTSRTLEHFSTRRSIYVAEQGLSNEPSLAPGAFPNNEDDQRTFLALEKLLDVTEKCYQTFDSLLSPRDNRVWLIETEFFKGKPNLVLKDMPVEIGQFLPDKNVTYMSATLALDGNFDTFASRVSLRNKPYKSAIFHSPFDIKRQAYLYTPVAGAIPEPPADGQLHSPAKTEYLEKISYQIHRLIEASQGDALVLFTAKNELEYVKKYLQTNNYPYPVIAQGDYKPNEAFERYKQTPKATLLGLKSFWEGIDVQGKKLFLVIITKLPMPMKSDPIIAARIAKYEESFQGFMRVQIPEMLFDLRQGMGRLIRSKTDKGVIALLDSRVYTKKSYGPLVLRTLGLTPIRDLDKMCKAINTRHAP